MPTIVGPKGQVVIEKAIRSRLGVRRGALAIQTLMGDHVEIRFLPPEHGESLFGTLSVYAGKGVSGRGWSRVKRGAWAAAVRDATPTSRGSAGSRPGRPARRKRRA
jgi:bifunctional DNA-binding transcriptional regulator/antitoxin component of YhaV-PrlF toxin-antitoxin module